MKKIFLVLTLAFVTLVTVACSGETKFKYVDGKINIVATTTMLGDLAKEVGGEHANVYTVMSVGVDPHSYKPKSSNRQALKQGDLVIHNGLHLEAQMADVIAEFSKDTFVASSALSNTDILQDDNLNTDPHIWFNVAIWRKVAVAFSEKLQSIDTLNQASYISLISDYTQKLDELDAYIKNRVAELPAAQRILVTAHDAFQYFAHAYGFEVHAIQGISTETEASTTDIQKLANLVKNLNVKAIFIESSIPQATIKSVIEASSALGHKLEIGGQLYSDSLGNGAYASYLNAIKVNVDTIVDALK